MRDLTVRNNVRRKRSNAIGQTLILILENEKQVGMIRFSRKTKMEQEEENDLPVAMRSFEVDKIVKLLRPLFALITSEALIILIILRWIRADARAGFLVVRLTSLFGLPTSWTEASFGGI
mmetsp:Transcript_27126/g.64853  ORF Transcript_27126/g.64853 Transcript_27126/m.64853 type:complete len:120 (-) Transcript_27126:678-1037(-)